jgi:hypothetical protein
LAFNARNNPSAYRYEAHRILEYPVGANTLDRRREFGEGPTSRPDSTARVEVAEGRSEVAPDSANVLQQRWASERGSVQVPWKRSGAGRQRTLEKSPEQLTPNWLQQQPKVPSLKAQQLQMKLTTDQQQQLKVPHLKAQQLQMKLTTIFRLLFLLFLLLFERPFSPTFHLSKRMKKNKTMVVGHF